MNVQEIYADQNESGITPINEWDADTRVTIPGLGTDPSVLARIVAMEVRIQLAEKAADDAMDEANFCVDELRAFIRKIGEPRETPLFDMASVMEGV